MSDVEETQEEPFWPKGTHVRHRHTHEAGTVIDVQWEEEFGWFDHVVEFKGPEENVYVLRYLYTSLEEPP